MYKRPEPPTSDDMMTSINTSRFRVFQTKALRPTITEGPGPPTTLPMVQPMTRLVIINNYKYTWTPIIKGTHSLIP